MHAYSIEYITYIHAYIHTYIHTYPVCLLGDESKSYKNIQSLTNAIDSITQYQQIIDIPV